MTLTRQDFLRSLFSRGIPPAEVRWAMLMAIRSDSPRGTYFVTSRTFGGRRVFQGHANAQLLIHTLQHYRHTGNYKLYSFVVMPDHIHLVLSPTDIALERALQLIKGGCSRRLESKFPVWQKGFTQHLVRDRRDIDTHRDYIYHNPVRARLCGVPEDYPFSSAYRPTGFSG